MNFTSRRQWGARYQLGTALGGTRRHVLIHHSASPHLEAIAPVDTEIAAVRGIERYHAVNNGWAGIGYNWLVAPSGRVYEGRGWNRVGAHCPGMNTRSYGVCILMNAERFPPTVQAIGGVRELIRAGISGGYVHIAYRVAGHRDHDKGTECPGDRLYAVLDRFEGAWPVLREGAVGAAVQAMQKALGIKADGLFTPQTATAVRAYQATRGLVVDAIVGPRTWSALVKEATA